MCSTSGVPTIWTARLRALHAEPSRWTLPTGLRLLVGGAAVPAAVLRGFDALGVRVIQGWGMTETSPVAAVNRLTPILMSAVTGVPVPFVELRVMTPEGEAPWDGTSVAELELRGPRDCRRLPRPARRNRQVDSGR